MNTKDKGFYSKKTLCISGKILQLNQPKVMGIINCTPDSFYAGSRKQGEAAIVAQAEKMLLEGADLLDIGGYSSRPGADDINVEEECERVLSGINIVLKAFPEALISVDTFRASVAQKALDAGAGLINDISGGDLDDGMFALVAEYNIPYIMMHMRGTPQNMQVHTDYDNLLKEIIQKLQTKLNKLYQLGVNDIIIDPGFGFAKTIDQNFELLRKLNFFKVLSAPLLIGISRKSFIYKRTRQEAASALNGTTAAHMLALQGGAAILRVHDVKEAKEAITIYNYTNG